MNILTNTYMSSKILYAGLAFILTIISGILLSSLGRPLNSVIFAIHKLIAVGAIILLGLGLRNMLKAADVQVLSLIFLVIAGLLFLALVISGALMSFERPFPQIFLNIHKVVPLLALVAAMMSIYSMAGSKS